MRKIYVYGTGRYARNFLYYMKSIQSEICGFIETKKTKNQFWGKDVFSLSEIGSYDYIIVASQFVYDIKAELYRKGVNLSKVIFLAQAWIPAKVVDEEFVFEFDGVKNTPDEESVFFDIGALYTTSPAIAKKAAGTINPNSFWNGVSQYDTSVHVPHVATHQKEMLERYFIPHLSKTDIVCDVGCASGEWSMFISPHVLSVEAYDVSHNLIETGIKNSQEYGFENISFKCVDALDIGFVKTYNHILLLSIGIYLEKEQLRRLIKNISSYIVPNGLLAVRDTVTMYTNRPVYMVKKEGGNLFENYTATYIPLREYEELYNSNGFEILEESYFSSYFHTPMELGAHGYILKKVK